MKGNIFDWSGPDIFVTLSSTNSALTYIDDFLSCFEFNQFLLQKFVFSSFSVFWNWNFSFSKNQIHCLLCFNGFLNIWCFLIFKFLTVGTDIYFANVEACRWSVKFCKWWRCSNIAINHFRNSMLFGILKCFFMFNTFEYTIMTNFLKQIWQADIFYRFTK